MTLRSCPECPDGVLELVTDGAVGGRAVPFLACCACEYCEEVAPRNRGSVGVMGPNKTIISHADLLRGARAIGGTLVTTCERCGAVKPHGQSCGCFDNNCQ